MLPILGYALNGCLEERVFQAVDLAQGGVDVAGNPNSFKGRMANAGDEDSLLVEEPSCEGAWIDSLDLDGGQSA